MNVGCASCLHLEDEFTDPEKLRVKGRISSEWQLCMNKVFWRAIDHQILRVKDGNSPEWQFYTWENFIMTIKMAWLADSLYDKGPCRFVQTNCDLNNSECTQRECKFGWESRSQSVKLEGCLLYRWDMEFQHTQKISAHKQSRKNKICWHLLEWLKNDFSLHFD